MRVAIFAFAATTAGSLLPAQASVHHQSTTHRVVVVNGKTVLDEKTIDGKPVRGVGGRGRPGEARAEAHASATATCGRRVVVVNGKKIIDEEIGGGRPRRAGRGLPELDRLLDRVRSGDRAGLRRVLDDLTDRVRSDALREARRAAAPSGRDARRPRASHRDSAHSDGVPRGAAGRDSIHPDSVHPDSIHPDSVHPDSIHPDSVHPDSVHPDRSHLPALRATSGSVRPDRGRRGRDRARRVH